MPKSNFFIVISANLGHVSRSFLGQRMVLAVCVALALVPVAGAGDEDPGLGQRISRYLTDLESIKFKYREPLSSVRNERLREFYRVHLADLENLDVAQLSVPAAVDYRLFRNELEYQLALQQLEMVRDEQAKELLVGVPALIALLEQHEQRHDLEPRATAEQFVEARQVIRKGNAALDELIAAQNTSATTTAAAIRAGEAVDALLRRLDSLQRFYAGYDPLFTWWCKVPYEQLQGEIRGLRERLTKLEGSSGDKDKIIGQPIGEEAMALELRHEMIPYSPEELIQIAEREFAWCDEQMLLASRELGCGEDWRAAMELVKQRHVEPGKQPAMIRDLALEAIEFLKARNLVTIPPLCEEIWRMEMMSPERQRLNPFFLGGDTIIVSYPTDSMTHEEKLMSMRGNNEHFARATVHHELIPGHHLQMFMIDRYRPYRKAFNTPFWIEGWALYWEMLLWDKGFARSAEDRVGMLFWRKHRCARIIFSLGYQLGRMTPEECVDYLVDRVGHERLNASAEVRRSVMGGYGPLYQAAYMLGGLQLRALRSELVDSSRMSEQQFHDAILHEGPIPIAMVRALLLNKSPENTDVSQWRFADPR
jgi:uncharacterized protein (DUF885 family)